MSGNGHFTHSFDADTQRDGDNDQAAADSTPGHDGPTDFSTVVPGQVSLPNAAANTLKLGRFKVIEKLGEGGFGTVYRARDLQLDRDVAVKLPRPGLLAGEADAERFLREGRAAALFRHPNICPVYEVGTTASNPFIVMAYIEGTLLSSYIKERGCLPQWEAAQLVLKVALALQEAHHQGIIHRDLKPANIIIDGRGEPVVMDFGLALRTNRTDSQLTRTGIVVGTAAYMSPEQAAGHNSQLGPRSDIYSLGIILYVALCGCCPFTGTGTEVVAQILRDVPTQPSCHRHGLSGGLEAVCVKAIAKRQEDRYASMDDFAAALLPFTQPLPTPTPANLATPAALTISAVPTPTVTPLVASTPVEAGPVEAPSAEAMQALASPPSAPSADVDNAENSTVVLEASRHDAKSRAMHASAARNLAIVSLLALAMVPWPQFWPFVDKSVLAMLSPTHRVEDGQAAVVVDPANSASSASQRDNATRSASVPAASVPDLITRVFIDCQPAHDTANYVRLSPEWLPLKNGDKVQFHIALSEAAYLYIYWYDAGGRPQRLYPASLANQQAVSALSDPPQTSPGEPQTWYLIGAELGVEFALVTASQTPLSSDDLREFESLRLGLARIDRDGRLGPVRLEPERAIVGSTTTRKLASLFDEGTSVLILPEQSETQLVPVTARDLSARKTSTTKQTTERFDDFEQRLTDRFQCYYGLALQHQ